MELVLRKTDIFDEKLGSKLNKVIKRSKDSFVNGTAYKMIVSFHVNLLYDHRFEEFVVVPRKTNKGTKEDKISDVLSFQLKELEEVLNKNGIEVYSTTIQGDCLDAENIIKIDISEDDSEPSFLTGRGKNKQRMKVSCIVPSLPYTQENVNKYAGERLGNIFYGFLNVIKDKKLMSEILEIEGTEDEKILFKAFANQYGDLWLATNEKKKELLERLQDRTLSVINKCSESK